MPDQIIPDTEAEQQQPSQPPQQLEGVELDDDELEDLFDDDDFDYDFDDEDDDFDESVEPGEGPDA